MAKSGSVGFVDIEIGVEDKDLMRAMLDLDTALDPNAVARWMGAVVGPYLQKRSTDRFRAEGDDVVGAWQPLREATWAWREKQNVPPRHPINRRTGELEDYITGGTGWVLPHTLGATLRTPAKPPSNKELRDKVETAQIGRDQPRTVPRPVMGMNEQDLTFVLEALALHIAGVTP